MARFKKIPQVQEGKLFYADEVLYNIVVCAVKEIPNVVLEDRSPIKTRSNAITVKKEKDGIHVEVVVKIHYLQSVTDMAFKIQEAIRHSIENMTENRVANVNVTISGVAFEDITEEINNSETAVQEG